MARAALPTPPDLYERDFVAWTEAQARELRRLADALPPSLDVARLAEEIEDLGKSERDAVRSQVRRILEHLLKLRFSVAERPRASWRRSVVDARVRLEDKLTPTLRQDVADRLPILYRQARRIAIAALAEEGEADATEPLPAACPFVLDQILDEAWYPAGPDAPAASRRRPARRT